MKCLAGPSNGKMTTETYNCNVSHDNTLKKNKPEPLAIVCSRVNIESSYEELNIDYDDENTATPKVTTSRCNSRGDRPMFLMPDARDTEPHVPEIKDRVDKAVAKGSVYLQVPTSIPRRRHSWMNR